GVQVTKPGFWRLATGYLVPRHRRQLTGATGNIRRQHRGTTRRAHIGSKALFKDDVIHLEVLVLRRLACLGYCLRSPPLPALTEGGNHQCEGDLQCETKQRKSLELSKRKPPFRSACMPRLP